MAYEYRDTEEDAEKFSSLHMQEGYKEYKRIEDAWLLLHYKIALAVVVFACLSEFIMGAMLIRSDLLQTTIHMFVWKYVLVPSTINFICVGINRIVMKSEKLSRVKKIYAISLSIVVVGFNLFTVHSIFWSTYSIFLGAIMMTMFYANYRLTGVTVIMSMVAIIVSELFIKWDTSKVGVFDSSIRMGDFVLSLVILIVFAAACMVAIRFERDRNEASIQMGVERYQLRKSLQMDQMTGIFNRKVLQDLLESIEENGEHERYILAMLDIDYFKSINDNWGHHFGDRCLIKFAEILKENSEGATSFRYGGDEFSLLFCDKSINEAIVICENIKAKMNKLHFEDTPEVRLTVSIGLAAYEEEIDMVRLLVQADHALYDAKRTRNTVRVYSKGK